MKLKYSNGLGESVKLDEKLKYLDGLGEFLQYQSVKFDVRIRLHSNSYNIKSESVKFDVKKNFYFSLDVSNHTIIIALLEINLTITFLFNFFLKVECKRRKVPSSELFEMVEKEINF